MSTAIAASPSVPAPAIAARSKAIDLVRGAVIVLMAIDHARVYSGLPAGGPTPGIFFTRWVTHFCAPAFVFLAGSSIFFYSRKHDGASRFLVLRGFWLIFLELTFLRLFWTFNFDFAHYEMAGILWVIGWCMVLMAPMVRLPAKVVGLIGLAVIAAHNLMDPHLQRLVAGIEHNPLSGLWKVLYLSFYAGPVRLGANGPNLIVLYSTIPWIGVMAAGYGFGNVLALPPERRNRICYAIGLGATGLFLLLRGFNLYGDPAPWHANGHMPALLSFLNTTKYPASLLFLLMTLGPIIALMPLLETARGPLTRALNLFGRVPFFFYVMHIPLIHLLALAVSKIRLGFISPWLFANHPIGNPKPPEGYTWTLPLLYLVWGIAILLLYFPCRWFARVRAERNDWWLKYL